MQLKKRVEELRKRHSRWFLFSTHPSPLVMFFLGRSGIVKSELAKQVAHYLHDIANQDKTSRGQSLTEVEEYGAFVRIDISEYQH